MMGDSEDKNADPFTDTLFSWSLKDISNENLYSHKVQTIPESFESVRSYLGCFVNPLLEETRAQLFSSMEILRSAPFAEVVAFEETTSRAGGKAYQVSVDNWRNRFGDRSKEPYKTLPGDLLVLTNAKPETISDLERLGRYWTFLSVTSIAWDDESEEDGVRAGLKSFKVKMSKEIKVETGTLFVVYLLNLTPNKRIWKSLHISRDSEIMKDVLCLDSSSAQVNQSFDSSSEMDLSSSLNESQNKAVCACLHSLDCNPVFVQLIWGPPGTGKTKTVATLLIKLLKKKVRTLICAPTNVAITEVASRVMKMAKGPFGDILLFGNSERLKVGSEMEKIYLDNRVQRLVECFGPGGLSSSIMSITTLLEDCVSEYHIFLGNELIKEKAEGSEKKMNSKSSFVEYVRERFGAKVEQLQSCISMLCTHVPESYIMDLIKLLDRLVSILSLEELFSPSQVSGNLADSFVDRNWLLLVKNESVSLLRSIHRSLEQLKFPSFRDEKKIKLFCFERASLVFCTVSTSYKLHEMSKVTPMSVLVIDEAAQLKECESTIPLQLRGLRLAILVGDECQLPATVTSQLSMEARFGRSLFERLSLRNHPKHLLNTQYRMHPSISLFPNSKFYRGLIQDAPAVRNESYEKHYLQGSMVGSYSFLNVRDGREEKDDNGHSRKNMVEVAIVVKLVQRLYKAWNESGRELLSIGIISPYVAQVVAIQENVKKKYDDIKGFQVKARTVDGFQGGEDDIVIMSTVRSRGSERSMEFISSHQRVNVTLTRARHCLWIIGDERALIRSNTIWGALVVDAKNRGCFFDVGDDMDLAKTIIAVKKELNHFDDLLKSDSILFKQALWKVLFNENFLRSFKRLTSTGTLKAVIDLVDKLSRGQRPQRPVLASGGESSMEIMKLKVERLYVISTVDIQKLSGCYIQVLMIWDILPLEGIPKLIKRVDGVFGKYSDEFVNLCNEKSVGDRKLMIPKTWPLSKDIVRIRERGGEKQEKEASSSSSSSSQDANLAIRKGKHDRK